MEGNGGARTVHRSVRRLLGRARHLRSTRRNPIRLTMSDNAEPCVVPIVCDNGSGMIKAGFAGAYIHPPSLLTLCYLSYRRGHTACRLSLSRWTAT